MCSGKGSETTWEDLQFISRADLSTETPNYNKNIQKQYQKIARSKEGKEADF